MKFAFRKFIPMIFIISIIQEIENKVEVKKTFTDLQEKIDNLKDSKLDIFEDYVFDPMVDKPTGIVINKPIIFDGKDFNIDGLNQSKLFVINNTKIEIRHTNLINGFSKDFGGAITLIDSSLNISTSNIFFNSANIKGGAIYLNNSYLNITDCKLKYNKAKSNYLVGGAIAAENSKIYIFVTLLSGNIADEGGAIYSINTILDIYSSTIWNNTANWYGGAIVSDSHFFINNTRMYNNKARYKGGAIHTTYSYSTEDCFLKINYSSFSNNSAEYGGAISSSNQRYVHINNSEFIDNHASYGAVISRMSRNDILINYTRCYDNVAIYGSILYSVAGGNNTFILNDFKNNKADVGGIIYTISGRYLNQVTNFNTTIRSCNLADNYGNKGLIYSIFDDLYINNTIITYLNKCYDIPVIYKIAGGKVYLDYNNWGEKNPDLNKLIIYEYDNVSDNNKINNKNLRSDGCSSTVIQIDDNDSAFTFRRDSSKSVYVNIAYQEDGILQYKTDELFFWHNIISKNGWIIGNGGVDSPHSCEKLEAYGKIMIKKNEIINEFIEDAFKIKSMQTLGHYFIKSPNGTYVIVSHHKSEKKVIIESGKLNSGEYIICPNNYEFYRKGKISELNIEGNYIYISRYLAAIDEYSAQRTNEFTYNYITKDKLKYIDIFVSNDDGSLSNKANASDKFNDIFINDKYILGEKVPIIMDGMYLDRYLIENKDENKYTNIKASTKLLLLFICLLIL